jgi:hypothetical protein
MLGTDGGAACRGSREPLRRTSAFDAVQTERARTPSRDPHKGEWRDLFNMRGPRST